MELKDIIKSQVKPLWQRLGFNSEEDMHKAGSIYRD